jgi:hypothetical protein
VSASTSRASAVSRCGASGGLTTGRGIRACRRQRAAYAAGMEHRCGSAEDDDAAVTVGGRQGWVRLWNRTHPYDDVMLTFCIEIGSSDMKAALHGVAVYNEAPEKFVGELAESFAGWTGAKVWVSLNGDLRIEARHKSRGYVDMTWSLAPWRERDAWTASVTVRDVLAGEEMRSLAADMRVLLG